MNVADLAESDGEEGRAEAWKRGHKIDCITTTDATCQDGSPKEARIIITSTSEKDTDLGDDDDPEDREATLISIWGGCRFRKSSKNADDSDDYGTDPGSEDRGAKVPTMSKK